MPTDTPATRDAFARLADEVHVYVARPEEIGAARRAGYPALLSPDERARYDRFHFEVHKQLYLVAHVLVRTTLSRYVSREPASWAFEEGEHGRPEIVPEQRGQGLRFNLSHTENLAAVLVCRDRDCGVDVERSHRVKDLDGVARKVFTAPEREDLAARRGDDREGRFTDYWTLKEAYMKARGMGFQLPPETFTLEIDEATGEQARLVVDRDFDDRAEDWQFELRPLAFGDAPDYRLAVAVRNGKGAARRLVVETATLP